MSSLKRNRRRLMLLIGWLGVVQLAGLCTVRGQDDTTTAFATKVDVIRVKEQGGEPFLLRESTSLQLYILNYEYSHVLGLPMDDIDLVTQDGEVSVVWGIAANTPEFKENVPIFTLYRTPQWRTTKQHILAFAVQASTPTLEHLRVADLKIKIQTLPLEQWADNWLGSDNASMRLWACKLLVEQSENRLQVLHAIDLGVTQNLSEGPRAEWLKLFDRFAEVGDPVDNFRPWSRTWLSRGGAAMHGTLVGYDLNWLRIDKDNALGEDEFVEVTRSQVSDWDVRLLKWLYPDGLASVEEADTDRGARVWSDSTGTYEIKGVFKSMAGNVARITTIIGKDVRMPVAKLSENDKDYLRKLVKAQGVKPDF